MSLSQNQPVGIRIENVNVSFGDVQVLKEINLDIKPGEFFTFLGPSGSGKSTLLRAIAGFGPAPLGEIFIGDENIAGLPPWKRNVGMVFQNYALWPHMSIRRNVSFGLEEKKIGRDEIDKCVDDALDLVELKHLADRKPSQLSGGQQQRIALARTIVVQPRVLLLDEPLSNLDANLRVQMRLELLTLQRELGLTTIFVTHDQEEANSVSDRIVVLSQGVVQQIGSPIELYDNPVNRFVAAFIGTANIFDGKIEASSGKQKRFVSSKGLSINIGAETAGDASLIFRPQNASIVDAATAAFAGTVTAHEFLGSVVRYSVDLQGHTVLVDDVHHCGQVRHEQGSKVGVVIDLDNIVIVRK